MALPDIEKLFCCLVVQLSISKGAEGSAAGCGACPENFDRRADFNAILNLEDMYLPNQKSVAPYRPVLLKVVKSQLLPKVATQFFPDLAAKPLLSVSRFAPIMG